MLVVQCLILRCLLFISFVVVCSALLVVRVIRSMCVARCSLSLFVGFLLNARCLPCVVGCYVCVV